MLNPCDLKLLKSNIHIFQTPEEKEALLVTDEYQEQMSESTFLFLTLDLPTAPLYKDEKEQLIIPQVPLFNILGKFNGSTEKVQIHSSSFLRYDVQNKIKVGKMIQSIAAMRQSSQKSFVVDGKKFG